MKIGRAVVVVCGVGLAASTSARPAQAPCAVPPPAGFAPLAAIGWQGPWVVDASTNVPLPAYDRTALIPIRFDDGREGVVRVTEDPCRDGEPCDPIDCGCLKFDRLAIAISDAAGRTVARRHFWAAYQTLSVIPVDLVGGPGDELVLVRIPAHSAPPSGHQLRIWRLTGGSVTDLVTSDARLARGFTTEPIACARWQSVITIDRSAAKPRPLTLRSELGSTGCCKIVDDDVYVADARRPRRFEFNQSSGTYQLTTPGG